MPKVYPEKIGLFLAAESLRQELGGKVTILGAFAGGQILLSPETPLPAHMPLALLIAFNDGEGAFDTKLRISDPTGDPVAPDLPTGTIDKVARQTMQVMVNFGIFAFEALGRYKVDVFLDDHMYTEHISIGASDKPFT